MLTEEKKMANHTKNIRFDGYDESDYDIGEVMEKDDEDVDILDDQDNHLYIDDEDLISEEEKTKIHSGRGKNMSWFEDSNEKFVKFDIDDVCDRDRDGLY